MTTSSGNPTNKAALTAKVTADNGGDFDALLQPANQAAFVAIAATPTQANVEALRAAMIAAGIMRPS